MKLIRVLFVTALTALFSLPLAAQEKQVPIFPDQEIMTINRGYAKKMSFFTEYDGFVEARLFLTPEKT